MAYCECKPVNLTDIFLFSWGDYGVWYNYSIFQEHKNLDTRMLTRNLEDVEIMCPQHHPFFLDLIEDKLNLDSNKYAKCILHAWRHVPSDSLKLIWNWEHENMKSKIRFGLQKAWRMYTRNNVATVKTYHYDSGEACSDNEDEYDL